MASVWDIFAQRLSDWEHNVSQGQRDLYGVDLGPNPKSRSDLEREDRLRQVIIDSMNAADQDRSTDPESGMLSSIFNPSGDTASFVRARERLAQIDTAVPGLSPYSQNVGDYVDSEADKENPFFRLVGNKAPTESFQGTIEDLADVLRRKGFSRAAKGSSVQHDMNLGIPVTEERKLAAQGLSDQDAEAYFKGIMGSKDIAKVAALFTLLREAEKSGMSRQRLVSAMRQLDESQGKTEVPNSARSAFEAALEQMRKNGR